MEITSIRIKKNNSGTQPLGVASIQLDNCLVIHDIKLIQLDNKRIISFPHRKVKKFILTDNGYDQNYEYTDLVHPSNSEFRNYIETELFKIYDSDEKGENFNE